jgi:hypothetical protein
MGKTALPPAEIRDTPSARRRFDRTVLLLFAVLAILSICIACASYLLADRTDTYELESSVLGSITLSFMAVGIPVYIRHRKSGLTAKKRVFRTIARLSIAMTVVSMVVTVLATIYAPDVFGFERMSWVALLLAGAFIAISLFATFMVMCYAALVTYFGVVGVMVAVERLVTPTILDQIVSLSAREKPSLFGRTIRWLFDIPSVLDTSTLILSPGEPRKRVFWSDLKAPVLWQLVFGFVLGIYISFNPFISDRSPSALLSMFTLLASASILFPFLILPWFLFMRLGASIKGQTKQFTLYDGIRTRVFRSYFAVGTIVIIVRLSIQEIAVAFETYTAAFAAFMVVVLMSALISTFVYMNYFENDLAEDVIEESRGTKVQVVA